MKHLKVHRMVVIHVGETFAHEGTRLRSEVEGVIAYTDEGSFLISCETLRVCCPLVQVDEYDINTREVVAVGTSS